MRVRISSKPLAVLDFDLENRPLSYVGGGFTTAEITAMAWSWVGYDEVMSCVLNADGYYVTEGGRRLSVAQALTQLAATIRAAGITTGHYIRKHDLPLLNGALIENRLPSLPPLLVHDTHQDLMRKKDLSASQESLAAIFGLNEKKHHMAPQEWRVANRLSPEGTELTRKRVVDDVIQHKALRSQMIKAGVLRPARWWKP